MIGVQWRARCVASMNTRKGDFYRYNTALVGVGHKTSVDVDLPVCTGDTMLQRPGFVYALDIMLPWHGLLNERGLTLVVGNTDWSGQMQT